MDKATLERVNQPVPFAEFPKMKYHPDGRQATVNSGEEESALGGEWTPAPADAVKIKAERDAAIAKREAAQWAKEAASAKSDTELADEAADVAAGKASRAKAKG